MARPGPDSPEGPPRSSRSPPALLPLRSSPAPPGPAHPHRGAGPERRGTAGPPSPRRHTHRPSPAASPRRRPPSLEAPRTALAGSAPTPHPKPGSSPFSVGPHAPRLAHPRPAVIVVLRSTAQLARLRCSHPLTRAATSPAARRPGFPDAHVTRLSPRHAGSCSPTAASPAGRQERRGRRREREGGGLGEAELLGWGGDDGQECKLEKVCEKEIRYNLGRNAI